MEIQKQFFKKAFGLATQTKPYGYLRVFQFDFSFQCGVFSAGVAKTMNQEGDAIFDQTLFSDDEIEKFVRSMIHYASRETGGISMYNIAVQWVHFEEVELLERCWGTTSYLPLTGQIWLTVLKRPEPAGPAWSSTNGYQATDLLKAVGETDG